MILHQLPSSTSGIKSPEQFTYPFCYVPHPLCIAAAEEVKTYLKGQIDWQEELAEGKMFGVLVVEYGSKRGFLAAFSGTLAGKTTHPYFVPPVFDLMSEGCYFQEEESRISEINKSIERIKSSIHSHLPLKALANKEIESAKTRMKEAKIKRDEFRSSHSNDEISEIEPQLIRESQFLKAECKRTERMWAKRLQDAEQENAPLRNQIQALQKERAQRSQMLQDWLFQQFSFLDAKGNEKNLKEIFYPAVPPGGAGECCAPRLLQTAYKEGFTPLCMAEFWIGKSPQNEVRHEGNFYPSCRSRCFPILSHMLQGLNVEPNPLLCNQEKLTQKLRIVQENNDFIVVDKPSGMLSVPGIDERPSVLSIIQEMYPNATGPMIVHRLDMDTSGLMLIALNENSYHRIQKLFLSHQIEKHYIALLEHPMPIGQKGIIELPLRTDIDDRPRQIVDFKHGRRAVTHYEVMGIQNGHALVMLMPLTGRTHQLRVHCAHRDGLNNPIVGDRLYGKPSMRLMLHAFHLSFLDGTADIRIADTII